MVLRRVLAGVVGALIVSSPIALLSIARPAHAGWTGAGLAVAPSPAHRVLPAVASDGAGGWYVAWVELPLADETAGDTVFVQRLDANGDRVAGWPERGVRLMDTGHAEQLDLVLASDGAVDVIESWTFCSGSPPCSPIAQDRWVLPGGTPDSPLRTRAVPAGPLAVSDDAGGHLILSAVQTLAQVQVALERRRPSGTVAWRTTLFEAFGSSAAFALAALADDEGGAWCLWYDGTSGSRMMLQRVDSTGARAPGWPAAGRVVANDLPGDPPALLPSGARGALIVWKDGTTCRSTVARVSPAGALALPPTPVTVSADCARGWRAVSDGRGGAIIAFPRAAGATGADLVLQLADADGLVTSGAEDGLPVCDAIGDQDLVGLEPDGANGAYVRWLDRRTGVNQNWVQRLDGFGAPVTGWPAGGRAVCPTTTWQWAAVVASDVGGLTLAWPEARASADPDLYAARITSDGATPTLASCVSADATPERVRLRWFAAGGPASARVGRAREDEAWADVGAAVAQGRDEWAFEDVDVTPGERVAYRLQTASGEALSEAAWLTIPAAPRLSIVALEEAAGAAAPRVRLVLASASPARLEVYDVAGRRVASRTLSGLAAGEHVVDLALPAGVGPWFLRLAQGEAQAHRRVVRWR